MNYLNRNRIVLKVWRGFLSVFVFKLWSNPCECFHINGKRSFKVESRKPKVWILHTATVKSACMVVSLYRTTKLTRYATMYLWTSDNTVACHSSRSDKVLHVKHINITTCFKLIRFLQTSLKPQMNSQIVWIFGLHKVSWEPHWQSWPQLTQIVISIQHDEAWKPDGTAFFTIAF